MFCVSLDGRGVSGRMDTCICVVESLCCPPETITTLLIGCTQTQNKKFKTDQKKREKYVTLKARIIDIMIRSFERYRETGERTAR